MPGGRRDGESISGMSPSGDAARNTLLDLSPNGVLRFDTGGILLDVNDAYCRLTGYARDELIGRSLSELELSGTAELAHRRIRKIIAQGADKFETSHRRKDGATIDFEVTARYAEVDGRFCVVAFCRDLGERRQAEQRIRQLNRLLHTITEINKAIVRERDRDTLLRECCRILVEEGQFRMAWVGLADVASGRVEPVAEWGFEEGYLAGIEVRCDDTPLGRGPTGTAIRSGRLVINANTATTDTYTPWRERALKLGYRSSGAFPLRVDDEVIGAVNVYADRPYAFGEEEVALLQELVGDIGFALEAAHESSERRRGLAALRESEERFRRPFHDAPIGMALVAPDERFIEVNHALCAMLGYTRDELLDMTVSAITHPDDRHVEERYKEGVRDGQDTSLKIEKRYLHKDGHIVWGALSVSPIRDAENRLRYYVGQLEDITARRAARDALRRERDFTSAILDTVDAVVAVLDRKGRIIRLNHAAEALSGYTFEELEGRFLWDTVLPPDQFESVRRVFDDLTTGHFPNSFENDWICKNGERRLLAWSNSALVDDAGRVEYVIATGIDITDSRKTQQRLLESEQRFRTLVEQAPEAIVITDIDSGMFVDANQLAAEMLGMTREALLQTGPVHLSPHEQPDGRASAELAQAYMDQVMGGGTATVEWTFLGAGGRLLPCEVRLVRFPAEGRRLVRASFTDISERLRVDEALHALAEATAGTDIQTFYRICVENLCRAYGARYAFIGLTADAANARVRTVAVWANDALAENFEYGLKGTPCAGILDRSRTLISRGAQSLYPDDALLMDMNVESYFGVPLVTAGGETIGLVAVMHVDPMPVTSWSESMLTIFSERIASELQRRYAEDLGSRLGRIIDSSSDEIFIFDADRLNFTHVNNSALSNLQYDMVEMLQLSPLDLHRDMDRDRFAGLLEPLKDDTEEQVVYEAQFRRKDGSYYPVEVHVQFSQDVSPPVFVCMALDITQRLQSEAEMRKLSSALEHTADAVVVTDPDGRIEYVNPAFEVITGYAREEAIGKTTNILKSSRHDDEFYGRLWEQILRGEVYRDVLINRRKDGSLYYEEKTITPLKDHTGAIINFISTGKDITERMQTQERLHYLAHHDVLTELPNRVLFIERLNHALSRAAWHQRSVAVLFLDLDRFKLINDTLGHDFGDCALQALAKRLMDMVREGDTVARLGGDEFAILLEDIADTNDVAPIARKMLKVFTEPFVVNTRELFVTASIGISMCPVDGDDAQSLLKHADVAMYRAKEQGRNSYQFYSADMSARAFERLSLETNLRHALERKQFLLYYQPQVDTVSGGLLGVEALLRWQHPELGIVAPAEFIPLLEETGLINDVGEWVLYEAAHQLKSWMAAGLQPGRMAINLSGRQFDEPALATRVATILRDVGIDPALLEFEITESVLMKNERLILSTFRALEEMGIRLAIDDFGTGYSSLSYIKRFPIDTFKIDRSFVRDISSDPDDAAIVSAIIAMGKSLKLHVIAEGVEDRSQAEFLRNLGCDGIQGYLYSRPLTAAEMTDYLQARR